MAMIGIDLGTTNSLACVWRNHTYELIPNAFGSILTPSIVSFLENGEVIVGEAAKQRGVTHPEVTFSEFKRSMGSERIFHAYGKEYLPQDLSAFVIRKLVEDARVYLQEDIEEAIISVPAYFNDDQRWATKIAGMLAGVRVERIINEPSAAALSQHMEHMEEDVTCLVVDFGGGTLDISIVESFDNVVEIRAISGDNHLGGSDFDEAIQDAFLSEHNLDKTRISAQELILLTTEIERCKKVLSTQQEVKLITTLSGQNYEMILNRGKIAMICMPLLTRMRIPLEKVLKDTQLQISDLDQIILAGGTCRMPTVIQYLEHLLKRDVTLVKEPDQAIAIGCGVASGIKSRQQDIKDIMLSDICPFTLGIEINDDHSSYPLMAPIIERNTSLPNSVSRLFSYRSMNGEIDLKILQGEHRRASANLLLKTVSIQVPEAKTYQPITIRFTYDINGLLEIETNALLVGEKQRVVIQNRMNRMSEEQLQQRLKELEKVKMPNHQKEVYRHLLEWGERLFYESQGEKRRYIENLLKEYEEVLEYNDTHRIHNVYKRIRKEFTALDEDQSGLLS